MNSQEPFTGRRKPLATVFVVFMLVPLGYSVGSFVFARSTTRSGPFLEQPAGESENCVRDTEYMRFHHMELLNELRDAGVREGEKLETSIKSCRECHLSRERFCDQCHHEVNLSPDCFGCHYYP